MAIVKTIDKGDILGLLRTAKVRIGYYEKDGFTGYGTSDDVALRLLESRDCIIVNGIKLSGDNVTLGALSGALVGTEPLWHGGPAVTYSLKDFSGTTISRFAYNLCDIIIDRALHGTPGLREIMMPNAVEYARRTQSRLKQFTD